MRVDYLHFVQPGAGLAHQMMLDGQHHFPQNEQAGFADEQIQGEVYRPLQAVLDGYDALAGFAGGHGTAHRQDGGVGAQVGGGVIQPGGFFGKGAVGAQKGQRTRQAHIRQLIPR